MTSGRPYICSQELLMPGEVVMFLLYCATMIAQHDMCTLPYVCVDSVMLMYKVHEIYFL
jgi:hypothetical protein